MNNDIKIGSTVQILYWKDNKIHEFVIIDIFFEQYIFFTDIFSKRYSVDYKTVVKGEYYSKKSNCWFIETYFVNDFFEAMNKAKEITEIKEEENE